MTADADQLMGGESMRKTGEAGALVSAGLLCLLLTGCGGGGGGVASTPPPPPPPPPPATPFPLAQAASFDTIPSTTTYTGQPTGSLFEPGSSAVVTGTTLVGRSSTLSFSYDPANGTYTVQESNAVASFGPGDRSTTSDYSNHYARTSGTTTDDLALYGNVKSDNAAAAPLQLSYTSYGFWTHSGDATGQNFYTYFVYGQPTGAADMPKTGTASYQTIVSAKILRTTFAPSTFDTLSGSATFSANFGTGTVDTVLTLAADSFTGTAPIGADQFFGNFTSKAPWFQAGNFAGSFFGPKAQEMGYAFSIYKRNPDPYAGAAVMASEAYISGVVLGRKR